MTARARSRPSKPAAAPQEGAPAPAAASVLAQLAALAQMPIAALKARWRELNGTEPPP